LRSLKLSDAATKSTPAITGVGVGPLDQTQLYMRAQFNAEEVNQLKQSFESLDFDRDGAIDEKDLLNAMKKWVYLVIESR
jgi:Ca2+-binding EF-hand superfamily protein